MAEAVDVRSYRREEDATRVARLLLRLGGSGALRTWLRPRWEYFLHHPMSATLPLERCGVVEADDEIVGAVHFEGHPALAYLQADPAHDDVRRALLDYAERRLGGWSATFGRDVLGIWVHDRDPALADLVAVRGYERHAEIAEVHARLDLTVGPPSNPVPPGYRLQTLADENDLARVNRVLWRGFGHDGPAPASEIPGRRAIQEAPGFGPELNVVVVDPDGWYVAYAGVWFVPEQRVGYVEPVATDPHHRGRGLASAALSEAVRRVAALGATAVWVGSDLGFYRRLGFEPVARSVLWVRPAG